MPKKIDVLIPVFNEQDNIIPIVNAIEDIFENLQYIYEIIFIDDGSKDKTLLNIQHLAMENSHIKFISLSKNFGKNNAILAGLNYSTGDALITMDADLQHPPEMIPQMIEKWEKGSAVVYTYRTDKGQYANHFQQFSSKIFYKLINSLSDVGIKDGIADFRLHFQTKIYPATNPCFFWGICLNGD